jgi:RNA polymerase sigma-70 factor (ECF subfamily)
MERYSGPVFNLAYRFLFNRADAEEIAQEVFLKLYLNPPVLKPSVKLFTWVYRVTVNASLDRLRQRKRAGVAFSIDQTDETADGEPVSAGAQLSHPENMRTQIEQRDRLRRAREAMMALPEPLKAPLILSVVEEKSHSEIAAILKISSKAVERRIHRAREILKGDGTLFGV